MSTNNICFNEKMTKNIIQLSSNTHLICSQQSVIPTNFERFMSLRILMTHTGSGSSGLARLNAPKVRSTDRMFLRPKS